MLIEGNLHAAPPIGLASFRIDARSTRISLGPTRYAVSRPWEIQRRIVLTSTSKYSAVFLMSGLGGSCAGVITVCGCLTLGFPRKRGGFLYAASGRMVAIFS